MAIWKEQYSELEKAALSPDASPEDVARLGVWFERFGAEYWNGEFYDVDGVHQLRSVDVEDDDGDFHRIGWDLR